MQLASDNFMRTNSNPLSGSWAAGVATAGLEYQIVSDSAEPGGSSGTNTGASRSTAVSWPNDHYSEITPSAVASSTIYIGPAVRIDPAATGNYYAFLFNSSSGSGVIQVQTGGMGSTIATATGITISDFDVIRLSAQGNTITAYKNGVSIASATDSTYTSGSAGMCFYAPNSSFALMTISLWAGGNFSTTVPNQLLMMGLGT